MAIKYLPTKSEPGGGRISNSQLAASSFRLRSFVYKQTEHDGTVIKKDKQEERAIHIDLDVFTIHRSV